MVKDRPDPERDKISLLDSVSVVGLANFLIFGFINYRSGSYTSAYFEWSLAGAAVLNLAYLHKTKDTRLPSSVSLFLIGIALIYLLLSGGIDGTGIFWFFTFPALAFFLKGKQVGWTWFATLLFTVGIILLLQSAGELTLPYPLVTMRQLVVSLLTVAILIYFYQSIIENKEGLLKRNLEEIKRKNLALEKSVAAAEEKARDDAFLACIGEGVVITDPEARVVRMNEMAEQITGYRFAEVQGKQWGIDVPQLQDDRGKALPLEAHALTKTLQKGKPATESYYYVRKDGQPFPIVITVAPVIFRSETIGAILVFRDITQEKAADQAKSEFISLASHQLRTPLSEIRWYVELMERASKHPKPAEQEKYLGKISAANLRMIDLINDLLNISSIEMGTFKFNPQEINLKELVETVIEELHPQITTKQLKVRAGVPSSLKKTTDRTLLYILLQNLLSNAVKYSPKEGVIEVTLEPDPEKKQAVLLTISDHGYGIPADQQDQIFTKLFRAENVSGKGISGTGLGLYVVKSIVDFLKGSIRFTSKENQGTTFYVTLPLSHLTP